MSKYKEGLPPIPKRLLSLPVERGYPVPWFVAEVDGHYDFRVVDGRKFKPAIENKLCWICGQRLGTYLAFSIGPMCVINRTISEPPSHRECAEWSIKACPFLTQKEMERRTNNLPSDAVDAAGCGLKRQPGAVCLWMTKTFKLMQVSNGLLFRIGDPVEVLWFRESRAATREEVLESINSGFPSLMEVAKLQGYSAITQLERQKAKAMSLIPSA